MTKENAVAAEPPSDQNLQCAQGDTNETKPDDARSDSNCRNQAKVGWLV